MRASVYTEKLGQLWANFHSLEMLLRSFLALRDPREALEAGQSFDSLAVGDIVRENPTTDYSSLGQLIARFNKVVPESRRVDPSLVELRDALAHGRVWSNDETFPLRLLKFGRPTADGKIEVTWASTMTEQWLDEQRQRVFEAMCRVYGKAPA